MTDMKRWIGLLAAGWMGAATVSAEPVTATSVVFRTSDEKLQRLYDTGNAQLARNVTEFSKGFPILVEGGGYDNAWIETQPMGGEMHAKNNLQLALNNQLIFMRTQREDGRLPGMVVPGEQVRKNQWDKNGFPPGYVWVPEHDLVADYEMFQGYCFPEPAWRMNFWIGGDREYLEDLYRTLEGHDAYLWRTRDSNGDGLLETWCVWDTGEDGSTRLKNRGARENWPYESAPGSGAEGLPEMPADARVPFQSMDVMSYSYSGRAVLAEISKELGNGREDFWRQAALDVRRRVIDRLWDDERKACFDRDRDGKVLPELIHNNLRCMWFGTFTQEMADAFIRHHLLNPEAFWTPVPLASIARNEPLFLSRPRNNWSGQPQGLTYQRAIHALERYGHVAEITLLGRKLLPILIRNDYRFSQQLDPVTGEPSLSNSDGYGPMILAMQEYVSRMHGTHLDVVKGQVWWSGMAIDGETHSYRQQWGERVFEWSIEDGEFTATVNGTECFRSRAGCRVITDLDGRLVSVVGISPVESAVHVAAGDLQWSGRIGPNEVKRFDSDRLTLASQVAFDYPYRAPAD